MDQLKFLTAKLLFSSVLSIPIPASFVSSHCWQHLISSFFFNLSHIESENGISQFLILRGENSWFSLLITSKVEHVSCVSYSVIFSGKAIFILFFSWLVVRIWDRIHSAWINQCLCLCLWTKSPTLETFWSRCFSALSLRTIVPFQSMWSSVNLSVIFSVEVSYPGVWPIATGWLRYCN